MAGFPMTRAPWEPVSGRHHRKSRWSQGVLLVAAGAVVVLAVGVGWIGYRQLSHQACSGKVTVTVAAAAEIAPAVQAGANQWSAGQSGTCTSVAVTATESGDMAAAVAGQRGVTLNGLGQAGGKTPVPDVWIPDSSTWLSRVRTAGADLVPAQATSIAQSPVVLAVPQPVAASLGTPGTKPTWAALLQKMTTGTGIKAGIVEPGRDAAGLNSLLTLRTVAAALGPGAQEAIVAALRALAANRSTLRADLLARFPRAADPAALTTALTAAPLPEQAVIAYNAAQPAVPLAAVFVDPAPAALDYPYAVMPGARAEARSAAIRLLAALSGPGYRDQLAKQGLRAADGTTGAGFKAGPGAPVGPLPAAPPTNQALVDQTLATWAALIQPGQILAVLDVSGSMLTPVPTAGGATREQVATKAAAGGLKLLDDSWAIGLWIFSTNVDGTKPYKELVPLGPLASQREQMLAALGTVAANPRGNTGLYDTVLAAYQNVQEHWDGGKVNSVVLFTDGINDNPGGMTLDQLLAQLRKIADPHKRVQVIVLGMGTDVAKPVMKKITDVTGGDVFIATDPANIGKIFLQALALRPGTTGGN
jgi:hypothetical protein